MSADGKDPTTEQKAAAKKFALRVLAWSMIVVIPIAAYFIFHDLGDETVSWHGHFARFLGVIFALLSALLFMGIIFYSSRAGYDDQPNYRELVEKDRAKKQGKKDGR